MVIKEEEENISSIEKSEPLSPKQEIPFKLRVLAAEEVRGVDNIVAG
jgi:hypothetical protein